MDLVQVDRRPHPCCNEPANLQKFPQAPDRYMEKCAVCGCRHFVVEVDPIHIGVAGKGI